MKHAPEIFKANECDGLAHAVPVRHGIVDAQEKWADDDHDERK
jgi:hypothetical protein